MCTLNWIWTKVSCSMISWLWAWMIPLLQMWVVKSVPRIWCDILEQHDQQHVAVTIPYRTPHGGQASKSCLVIAHAPMACTARCGCVLMLFLSCRSYGLCFCCCFAAGSYLLQLWQCMGSSGSRHSKHTAVIGEWRRYVIIKGLVGIGCNRGVV